MPTITPATIPIASTAPVALAIWRSRSGAVVWRAVAHRTTSGWTATPTTWTSRCRPPQRRRVLISLPGAHTDIQTDQHKHTHILWAESVADWRSGGRIFVCYSCLLFWSSTFGFTTAFTCFVFCLRILIAMLYSKPHSTIFNDAMCSRFHITRTHTHTHVTAHTHTLQSAPHTNTTNLHFV